MKTLKIWLVVDEERVSNLRRHCCVLKLSLFRAYALLASLLSTVHSLSSFYFVSHYSCSLHDCTAGLSRFSFLILANRKKKQLCVNAESEIENNSAWEKVIGSVVVRHLNFGWTTQRVCVIYISEGIVEFFVKKCGNILRDAGQPHAKFCPIYFCQNWAPFRSIFWSSRSNEKGKEVNYYYTTTYLSWDFDMPTFICTNENTTSRLVYFSRFQAPLLIAMNIFAIGKRKGTLTCWSFWPFLYPASGFCTSQTKQVKSLDLKIVPWRGKEWSSGCSRRCRVDPQILSLFFWRKWCKSSFSHTSSKLESAGWKWRFGTAWKWCYAYWSQWSGTNRW